MTSTTTKKPLGLWERAAWRWLTIATIMAVLLVIYTQHPYYRRGMFAPWRPFFQNAFYAWLAFGLFYCRATVWRFSNRKSDMVDATLHWMLIGRAVWRGKWSYLGRLVKNRRVKTSVLSLCVKAFFAPLMTSFLSGHANNISRMWANRKHQPVFTGSTLADWSHYVHDVVPKLLPDGSDVSALFSASWYSLQNVRFASDVFYDGLFFVDTIWALMGYCSESQWFKNKTRSVEPTALGWAAAIFCYPPFNDVLGTYLPLQGTPNSLRNLLVSTLGASEHTAEWTLLWCRILMLGAFTIYVWATLAFGMKFSNLTNRGIVSRGPYAFFRHPAYVCKGFAWWMEWLPNMSIQTAVFLVGLNGVYALRAWTEERHLSRDPAYREYKKKVPWVLIPRVW